MAPKQGDTDDSPYALWKGSMFLVALALAVVVRAVKWVALFKLSPVLLSLMMLVMMIWSGYYRSLRILMESRLPSVVDPSDSGSPPSVFADNLLMLVTRPLTLDADRTSAFSYVFSISLLVVFQSCGTDTISTNWEYA